MRDYASLHTELVNRQTELKNRLQRIERDITRSHRKPSVQAQELENREALILLRHEAERELREIGAALIRPHR